MKIRCANFLLIFLVASCATYETLISRGLNTLEIGVSTKADAIELLGPPTAEYRDGSQLLYEHMDETAIPIPAPWVGLGFWTTVDDDFLFLEFDEIGILQNVTVEETSRSGVGPLKISEPLANAFSREAEDILAADVAWLRKEAGCSKSSVWLDEYSWDKRVVFVRGSDFFGFAKWRDTGHFDVVWTSENVEIVSVSLDSYGRSNCVVVQARELPSITFSLPSSSVWLSVDNSRNKSAFSELKERTR